MPVGYIKTFLRSKELKKKWSIEVQPSFEEAAIFANEALS